LAHNLDRSIDHCFFLHGLNYSSLTVGSLVETECRNITSFN